MPTFEFLAKGTVGAGGAASLTLSNIPQVYDDLRLIMLTRSTANANNAYIRFNGDSTASGYVTQISFNNNGSTTVPSSSQSNDAVTSLTNQNAYDSLAFAPTDFYIPLYRSYSQKTIYGLSSQNIHTTGVPGFQYITGSTWSSSLSSSAIQSITITVNSGNLAQYSVATLYGIKRT